MKTNRQAITLAALMDFKGKSIGFDHFFCDVMELCQEKKSTLSELRFAYYRHPGASSGRATRARPHRWLLNKLAKSILAGLGICKSQWHLLCSSVLRPCSLR